MRLPGPGDGLSGLGILWREPLFKGVISGFLGELFRSPRPLDLEDESIGSFVSRRVSPHVADNITSALFHGIYAGDIYQLSIKSIARLIWELEIKYGSVLKAVWQSDPKVRILPRSDAELLDHLVEQGSAGFANPKDTTQYSFKLGIDTLVRALVQRLELSGNVTLKTQTEIKDITYDGTKEGITVCISTINKRVFGQYSDCPADPNHG